MTTQHILSDLTPNRWVDVAVDAAGTVSVTAGTRFHATAAGVLCVRTLPDRSVVNLADSGGPVLRAPRQSVVPAEQVEEGLGRERLRTEHPGVSTSRRKVPLDTGLITSLLKPCCSSAAGGMLLT